MISVDEIPFGRSQSSHTSDHRILAGFNRRITNVQPEHSFHQAAVQGQGDTGDSSGSGAIAAGMVWVHAEARRIRSGNTRGRNLNYEALADGRGRTSRGLGEEVPST